MNDCKAAVLCAALCACGGTLFIEPNPPRLRRVAARYTTSSMPEPLVFLPLFDLYVEDPAGCAPAKSWFADAAHRAVLGLAPDASELAARDLAPRCTQREGVELDVSAVLAEVRAVALARPQAHLRPVILYANGLDLPLSASRSRSLVTLLASLTAELGRPPLLWLVASKAVSAQLVPDQAQDWTYAGDPAMAAAMRSFAELTLPLQTEVGTVSQPLPLLGSADLESVQQFKLCSSDSSASLPGLPGPGVAARLARAAPPLWSVVLPAQVAARKSSFSTHTVRVGLEVCDLHCDRYTAIDPDQLQHSWDTVTGCQLPEVK